MLIYVCEKNRKNGHMCMSLCTHTHTFTCLRKQGISEKIKEKNKHKKYWLLLKRMRWLSEMGEFSLTSFVKLFEFCIYYVYVTFSKTKI